MAHNNIFRFSDVEPEVETLKKAAITKGLFLGFIGLHEFYSYKTAGTTYIYSQPFAGKSELSFELMMNLAEFYGIHQAIYSPESGNAAEIYAELLSKKCRKPFYKNFDGCLGEDEYLKEKDFINEYFYIIDPKDTDLTIEGFYNEVANIERKYEITISATWCDPFNELDHKFGEQNRQDLYIENRLGLIRRNAMAHNRHNFIITHSAEQEPTKTKEGSLYYAPATARQIAGGQAWYRKAMNLICVWRPPAGVIDPDTGAPYGENEAHVIIRKFKPKGVGKIGKARLFFDTYQNRFYEVVNGTKFYARKEFNQMPITPNLEYEF